MEYKENLSNEINDFGNEVHNDLYSSISSILEHSINENTFSGTCVVNSLNYSEVIEESFFENFENEEDSPYLDLDEIPEIKIRNEDFFESGAEISNYLKNLNKFDDSEFNCCRNCNSYYNAFYCKKCKNNLCKNCSENKRICNHELMNLQNLAIEAKNAIKDIKNIIEKINIKPKKENPKEELQKIDDVKEFNDDIKEFNNLLDKIEIEDNIDNYKKKGDLELIERIIRANYNNYFHYKNILECKKYLENRYNKCANESCMLIKYNTENLGIGDELQLFGDDFVKNNNKTFSLIINNEISDLRSKTTIKNNNSSEVILVQKSEEERVKNLSCMFQNCSNLENFGPYKDHKLIDFSNVKDTSYMFSGCTKINSLDLTSFGTFENVTKMDSVFSDCNNLTKIKFIEHWNTSKVETMPRMFNGCEKLEKIKGIKYFNTQKVTDFSEMFCGCKGLKSITEVKKWNMEKAKNLKGMFKDCSNLKEFPDISEWKTKNVKNTEDMFCGCTSLKILPKFSKEDKKNVENVNKTQFFRKKPDISK